MVQKKVRAPMSPSKRAKQFQPFDALKGFKEAIAKKEVITVPRKELSADRIQEINEQLVNLQKGQTATIVYYGMYEQKYLQTTGKVHNIDSMWQLIQVRNVCIDFSEILEFDGIVLRIFCNVVIQQKLIF